MVQQILDAPAGGASATPGTVARDHAAAILFGRLAREHSIRGAPASTLREIACGGPPSGAWLAAQAPAIAEVCRYAEEVAALHREGRAAEGESLLRFVNLRASEVLSALDQEATGRALLGE
jgi:hypothetical protein